MAMDEEYLRETVERIAQTVKTEKPGFVVDVNGMATLPMGDADEPWLNERCHCYWCTWWWDDPFNCVQSLIRKDQYAGRLRAWQHPHNVHFIWDEVLSREYTVWFGKKVRWLPTATHGGIFSPDAGDNVEDDLKPVQLSFLGNCPAAPRKPYPYPDASDIAQLRMTEPELSYFDMKENDTERLMADFADLFDRAVADPLGPVSLELLQWKKLVSQVLGINRRVKTLDYIEAHLKHTFYAGEGWPDHLVMHRPFFQPAHLVQRYRSSMLNVEIPSGEAYTGTAMRAYEIMSAGALLLCPAHPDFDPLGKMAHQAYVPYSSLEDMIEQWKIYGARADRREAMGLVAREYVLKNHTWRQRLQDILTALVEETSKR